MRCVVSVKQMPEFDDLFWKKKSKIINNLKILITCWNDNVSDMLGYIKYNLVISLAPFHFLKCDYEKT